MLIPGLSVWERGSICIRTLRLVRSITCGSRSQTSSAAASSTPGLLGFQVAVESPPPGDPSEAEAFRILFGGVVMVRGDLLPGLRPAAPDGDRFDPDRVGLDHLSFSVASRDDLEQAIRLFDEQGVPHGNITRLPSYGIDVLPFEDPDGIQLELTAPAGQPAAQG
jgi:glyoxylase I family protein